MLLVSRSWPGALFPSARCDRIAADNCTMNSDLVPQTRSSVPVLDSRSCWIRSVTRPQQETVRVGLITQRWDCFENTRIPVRGPSFALLLERIGSTSWLSWSTAIRSESWGFHVCQEIARVSSCAAEVKLRLSSPTCLHLSKPIPTQFGLGHSQGASAMETISRISSMLETGKSTCSGRECPSETGN